MMLLRRAVIPTLAFLITVFAFAEPPATTAPKAPDPLSEAKVFMQIGEYAKAIDQYKAVLAAEPNAAAAHAGLVRAYLNSGRPNEAYGAVKEGLLRAPESKEMTIAKAETTYRQGNVDAALREFAAAINKFGPDPRAYLGLYHVHSALSNHAKARAMIGAAYNVDPLDPEIAHYFLMTRKAADRAGILEESLEGEDVDPRIREDRKAYLQYLQTATSDATHPCKLVGDVRPVEVPLVNMMYDPQHLRGYGLDVRFNGNKSLMLLDTGASGLTINKHTADKAGVKKLHDTKIFGVGAKGARDAYVGYVDSIKIGGLEFQDCLVDVVTDRSVVDDGGLVGSDVFDHFIVTISFPAEVVKLRPLPPHPSAKSTGVALNTAGEDSNSVGTLDAYKAPEMENWYKFVRVGHDILVGTRINEGDMTLFLLDTGAFANTISPNVARGVTKVHGDDDMEIKGVSGRVKKVYRADKATLSFTDLRQVNQDLVALDLSGISNSLGVEVSGTLGFEMLKVLEINIDYRDGLVKFNYDPNAKRKLRRPAP